MGERVGEQFGNYRLMRFLGEGGFAEVYLGEHIHLGSQVAIKVLHTKLITRDQEAFLREARMIAALEHPSIVHILDCGIERGVPYLVMNYAPHGTLRELHPKGTIVSLESVVAYVQQVASALQYAHGHKLIHRDVKPENMLLGRNQEVLLSDFGIALISSSSSSHSRKAAAGTVAYMAPEQLLGRPCPASDQYALGVVVYEWLSGDRPFHGSFLEVCAQHLHAVPTPLSQNGVTLSPGITYVVMKSLSKEPLQRFASIQDFATALDECSRQEATLVVPVPTQQPPSAAVSIALADQDELPPDNASSIPTALLESPNRRMLKPPPLDSTVSKKVSRARKYSLQPRILIALAILVIISSLIGIVLYQNNGNLANVLSGYPSYLSGNGSLAFFDSLSQDNKWSNNGATCQFIGGAYHVQQMQHSENIQHCDAASGLFNNFAFEVHLTITQGDCGGMVFRNDGSGQYYYYSICQDGTYRVLKYASNSPTSRPDSTPSPAIHTGLGQQNKIAIVASGNTMTFYANEQQIVEVVDNSYPSGSIGLAADTSSGSNATDVMYTNARVWTV